jgi:hypothetical protein
VSYKLPIANYEIKVALRKRRHLFLTERVKIREGGVSEHIETKKAAEAA